MTEKMYTLLSSAQKNVGDFLIYERAKQLLRKHKGMNDYLEFHSMRDSLDPHLDRVNATKAVIICGGPGCVEQLYPDRYPLASDLDGIRVPIVLYGVGWYGVPGDDATVNGYDFSDSTKSLFEHATRGGQRIAVRDYLTQKVLARHGFVNVVMTGCPSWYDLGHLGEDFYLPRDIKTVVFTPPSLPLFQGQAVEAMKMLRKIFPAQRLVCSFHRGIEADPQTPEPYAKRLKKIARQATNLGFQVVDVSYDVSKIDFYSECDLHVGYRVHGHIYFLSQRKPSFLLCEDGRGRGISEAISLPGIQAWRRTVAGRLSARFRRSKFAQAVRKLNFEVKANPDAVQELQAYLAAEKKTAFATFSGLAGRFRQHYDTMSCFLDSLP